MTARHRPIAFTLNGKRASLRVHPMKRLLDVLREDCGLTGTKEGCGEGECGACTVTIGGRAVNSCLVPVAQVAGAKVVTIEGLKGRHPLQHAFAAHGGAQCGICTPGMIMAAAALGPRPSLDEVRTGLAGNICRCTGYEGIYRAIRKAEAGSKKQGARSKKQEDRRQRTGDRRQKEPAPGPAAERRRLSEPPGQRVDRRIPNPESRIPKANTRGRT
jgi:carbon-monoxide dehydrogenase small subunit/xanthine dehydrogenase small subunit